MAEAHWYVVHTYSGYENKVKANIDKTIENRHLEDQILEVRVPMQDVVELKNGAKKQVQKKMFPHQIPVSADKESVGVLSVLAVDLSMTTTRIQIKNITTLVFSPYLNQNCPENIPIYIYTCLPRTDTENSKYSPEEDLFA